ncbi:MAG: hypothetical protein L3J15_07985 [Devosiaceae bacterium]|nr:hypothetical protein [Devosiaceae bacterium]
MSFEFAIIGNTPMAALLACSLSKIYGRETALIGQFAHSLLPSHGFDISVDIITQPQTWRLIKENISPFEDLLKDFSNEAAYEKIDPLFIVRSQKSANALNHARNVAGLYGFSIEKQELTKGVMQSIQFRDAIRIKQRSMFAGLDDWLSRNNVKHLGTNNIELKRSASGGTKIISLKEVIISKFIIFVGDEAILNYMPQKDIGNNFFKTTTNALMLEPVKKLKSSTIINIDSNSILFQHTNGAIDCTSRDDFTDIYNIISNDGGNNRQIRLAGKAQFSSLISKDGAGVFGSLSGAKLSYIGGFGTSGAFLTPAMARILVGKGNDFENEYFAKRKPKLNEKLRPDISEFFVAKTNKKQRRVR